MLRLVLVGVHVTGSVTNIPGHSGQCMMLYLQQLRFSLKARSNLMKLNFVNIAIATRDSS